jgi:hypothetical protein
MLLSDTAGVVVMGETSQTAPLAASPVTPAEALASHPGIISSHEKADADKDLVTRWLAQYLADLDRKGASNCLLRYVQQDTSHLPLVLDNILQLAWDTFRTHLVTYEPHNRQYYGGCFPYKGGWPVGSREIALRKLHDQSPQLGWFHSASMLDAALRLANRWYTIRDVYLKQDKDDILSGVEWVEMVLMTKSIARCADPAACGGKPALVDASIFSVFWANILALFNDAIPYQRLQVATIIKEFLADLTCAIHLEVS